jgi:hypothetical protein
LQYPLQRVKEFRRNVGGSVAEIARFGFMLKLLPQAVGGCIFDVGKVRVSKRNMDTIFQRAGQEGGFHLCATFKSVRGVDDSLTRGDAKFSL